MAPDAAVDLSRRVVTVAGRELPFSSGSERMPTPTGRMTVTARVTVKLIPADELGFKGYDLKVPWFIELRASDGRTNYIAGLTYDVKAPGNYDLTSGWIGLGESDAAWLYGQLEEGSVVDIEGTAPTPTPVSTPTVTSPTDTAAVGP